jgi:hypothetical protein
MLASEIQELFKKPYGLKLGARISLLEFKVANERRAPGANARTMAALEPPPPSPDPKRYFEGTILVDCHPSSIKGADNDAVSSLANALQNKGVHVKAVEYVEYSIGHGTHVMAAAYIECLDEKSLKRCWGVEIDIDVVQASLSALLSAPSMSALV